MDTDRNKDMNENEVTVEESEVPVIVIPLTAEEIARNEAENSPEAVYERQYARVQKERQAAYQDEADHLFFYAERGKGQKQAWLDKVAEIDARLPYPKKPKGK